MDVADYLNSINWAEWIHSSCLELYTEEIKEELNLYELIKCYDADEFYSPFMGKVKLKFKENYIRVESQYNYVNIYSYNYDKKDDVNNLYHVLWPSKELYKKYPFEVYSAWIE